MAERVQIFGWQAKKGTLFIMAEGIKILGCQAKKGTKHHLTHKHGDMLGGGTGTHMKKREKEMERN